MSEAGHWDWDASLDEEDVGTLDSFSQLLECDVVKLLLPKAEQRGNKRYRCCRKDTFAEFVRAQQLSNERWVHEEEGSEYKAFIGTPLLGVDMLARDADFIQRLIVDNPGSDDIEGDRADGSSHSRRAVVLHVSEVQRLQPHQVKDVEWGMFKDPRHQVVVNLHHIAEANCERSLWCALDEAMSRLTCGRCPRGHALRESHAPVPWVCDRCERTFTRAARPRRCTMACDFDLCERCASLPPESGGTELVLAEMQQSLAEAAARGGCGGTWRLPQQPPQDKILDAAGSPIFCLSACVTKWNACQLYPEVAAEVRSSFLTALGVDAGSKHWCDFQPGTGREVATARHRQRLLQQQQLGFQHPLMQRVACCMLLIAILLPPTLAFFSLGPRLWRRA